jgi:FkbM family methyltransferase
MAPLMMAVCRVFHGLFPTIRRTARTGHTGNGAAVATQADLERLLSFTTALENKVDANAACLIELARAINDPSLFGTMNARLDGLHRELIELRKRAESLCVDTQQMSLTLGTLEQQIQLLRHSAPGRGNVALPGNRLLVRVSLPYCFPYGDPVLCVNADDKIVVPRIAMNGYYELESSHFLCQNVKANDYVVDIGAHFGYYTTLSGALVGSEGRVLAFEPHAYMASLLQENALINWIDPWVRIERAACWSDPGEVTLYASPARSVNTGAKAPASRDGYGPDFEFSAFSARAVTVDTSLDWLNGRVDFMKIDVEGSEMLVLRGARATIAANPQIKIMMEWSPSQLLANGFELEVVADELRSLGLNCFSLHHTGGLGEARPMAFDSLPSAGYQNIVLMR